MKACTLFIFLLSAITAFSQNNINSYKYVLVPERFDFSREDNQYGLNNTTKLMLEQKGFVAFLDNESLPPAVAANKCNALRAEVTQKKGFFVTNLTLTLKDCQGNILFKSKEGKSREKEFPVAYNEALRDAFSSLTDYKYDSTALTQAQQQAMTVTTAAPAAAPAPAQSATVEITGTLYAQPTANGYQLVDTSPKKVLTLLKTSMQDYYIADGLNGVVFKKDGEWIFEYYKNNQLVSKKLEIKF
jgi:glutamine synthetase